MRRTDGMLLAYLVVRRKPAARAAVREALKRVDGRDASSGSVAQLLIRAKALSPQEYVLLQARVEGSQHACPRCRRAFVCVPGPTTRARRCPCGHVNRVSPASETGARTRADVSNQARVESDDAHTAATHGAARLPRKIGRYQVIDRIGDGGMGIIFKVLDPGSRRVVALKLLRSGVSKDAEERFARETQAIARLRHPAIIQVHDVGTDERGRHFFTMDYVEGEELGEARKALDRTAFLEAVATVADGLHHAHEQGIIHRDVKPQNIIIEATGAARIADFGLARDLGRSSLTEEGDLVGTPLFMSPEQLRGDPSAIDRRTDVYALGVVLYEGLTERLPITAKSFPELQARMASDTPATPSQVRPDIPRALDRIVLRALEKAPEDRYPTAQALAEDLRAFLRGDLVAVPGPPMASSALRVGKRLARRLRTPSGLVALSLVAIGVVGTAALLHAHRRTQAEAAAHARLEAARAACAQSLAAAQSAVAQGRARLAEGKLDAAEEEAEAAARLADDAAARARTLGADAPRDAATLAAAVRDDAQALEAQALARGDGPARERARRLLEGLLERRTRDAELRLALGQLDLHDGHLKAAFDHLARARALEPERRDVRFWLAEAHMASGRAKFAEEDYGAALEAARPGAVSAAWALAGRARARAAQASVGPARADIDAALREDPRDPRVRVALAEVLAAEGREREALATLDEASRAHPREPAVRLACGLAWVRAGDRARALEELDAAIEVDASAAALAARARLRVLEGADDAATDDLARAMAATRPEDPDRRVVLLVEARHQRARGRVAEAIAAATQALEQTGLDASAPEALPLLLERAEARLLRGAVEDLLPAGRDLERALALAPAEPRVARAQGHLALARHDPQLALAIVNRRLERDPQDAECLVIRARALRALEDPRAAEAAGEAAAAQAALVRGEPRLELPVAGPSDEARVLLAQGRRALERARHDGGPGAPPRATLLARARLLLERAAALVPWLAPARTALGRALYDLHEVDAALRELDRAVETGGTDEAYGLRGELLSALGRGLDASGALGRALDLLRARPESAARARREADLRLARARVLLSLDSDEQALADLDRAIELDPKDVLAFELRASARRRRGDADGAAGDDARVELLRRGYVQVYEKARADAWAARARGDHLEAARALTRAFEVVSAERDPVRMADLYRVRAFMRVRNFALPDALIDLAAMIELTPMAFGELYDEVVTFSPEQGLNMTAILERVRELVPEQVDVDPDFLEGFCVFSALEFGDGAGEEDVRKGLRALDRFLDRRPSHVGALLVRAVLLLELGDTAETSRCVAVALETTPVPAFAHYVRARLRARARDREGSLQALAAALEARFTVYLAISREPDLAEVRQDPRFQRLLDLSQGAGYLASIERLERIARDRGADERAEIWRQCAAAATTGIKYLDPLLKADDAAAGLVAARLYLARARQAFRQGDARATARDVAAALEASPRVLLDYHQVAEAIDAVGAATHLVRDARPLEGEALPSTRFREAAAAILAHLRGTPPAPDEVAQALQRLGEPRGRPAAVQRALLLLAKGEPGSALGALRGAEGDEGLAPVAAWVEARAHAALDAPGAALDALARAVEGGLRGPLARDPALGRLAAEARFSNLATWARPSAESETPWRFR